MRNETMRRALALAAVILAAVLLIGLLANLSAGVLQIISAALVVVAVFSMIGLPAQRFPTGPEPVVRRFEQEGVIVIIPWQGRAVDIEKLPLEPAKPLPGEQDNFKLKRLVIDWRVYDRETNETVYSFDPPIKFQVAYTPGDVEAAGGLEKLKLASVVHKENRWLVFTREEHGFKLIPYDPALPTSGVAFVDRITMWDDRHTGYG